MITIIKRFIFIALVVGCPFSAFGTVYLNDDCSSLTGWSDNSAQNGTIAQTTYDGKSCFDFDTNTFVSSTNRASATKDIGDFPAAEFQVVLHLYTPDVGTISPLQYALFKFQVTSSYAAYIAIYDSGVSVYTGTHSTTAATIDGSYTEWTFVIDATTPASMTVDILQNGTTIVSGESCSWASAGTAGTVEIGQLANTANDLHLYVDNILIQDRANLSGTLKEKESDASGAAYQYLLLDATGHSVYAHGTAGGDGTWSDTVLSVNEYCGILIDNIGGWSLDYKFGTATTDGSGNWSITNAGWAENDTVWAFFVDPDKAYKTIAAEFTANASNQISGTHQENGSAASGTLVYAAGFGTSSGIYNPKPIFDFATGN